MKKRIIDADIVEKLLINIIKRGSHNIMGVEHSVDVAVFRDILRKINELSTLALVAQGGDRWNYDMTLAPSEYIAHNGCRLAYIEYGFITPLGDICAFDEEYFRKSVKAWKPMPEIPTIGDKS